MIKQIRFIFRYLKSRNRWRKIINAQMLMVVAISIAFLSTMAWSAPYSSSEMQVTSTPSAEEGTAVEPTPTDTRATPLPPEYLSNGSQTIGITLAATILVIIVVVGVLMFMPTREDS